MREVARVLGGVARSSRRLTGGVSAEVVALELETSDGIEQVVIRHHAPGPDWKDAAAVVDATRVEHGVMGALADAGLEVPRPGLLDVSQAVLPGPWFVLPFVEGVVNTPELASQPGFDAQQERVAMAGFLRRLHALPVDVLPGWVLGSLERRTDPVTLLSGLLAEGHEPLASPVLDSLRSLLDGESAPFDEPLRILHGDFWSGNLLWKDGRLVAVLDWEDAAVGDPLADLAGAYVELAWRSGEGASDALLRACSAGRPAIDPFRWACWGAYIAAAGLAWMGHWGLPADQEAHQRAVSRRLVEGFARTITAALSPWTGPRV